jgi:hypothetical protein
MKHQLVRLGLICVTASAAVGSGGSGTGVWIDPAGDATIRRTDVGNDAILSPGFEAIDLLSVRLEGWVPTNPLGDQYIGTVTSNDADFVRMQVVLDGLVSPPGPLALDGPIYDPQRFGDRPIYGYFEIDIDSQKNTGGELVPLARNRYLANVGRFGMSPLESISERIVRDADDLDSNYFTEPQFERSGGEFTLLLCGCFTPTIVTQDGNLDSVFDVGETWIVAGRFFERMVAFRTASAMFGGADFGLFDPVVDLQFVHDKQSDQTTITFVYPITNHGAALLVGQADQPIDLSLVNHTSMEEAIDDLIAGSPFATGALGDLVDNWENEQTDNFRRPRQWDTHAILGTAPTSPDPSALFIWTDTGFDEVFGDLDDNDLSNADDSQIILDTIDEDDGGSDDADGIVDGRVTIPNFGFSFDLTDLNGDGVISNDDLPTPVCLADLSTDGVLNFFDVSVFLSAFSNQDPIADFTGDGVFNFFDVSAFLTAFAAGCS